MTATCLCHARVTSLTTLRRQQALRRHLLSLHCDCVHAVPPKTCQCLFTHGVTVGALSVGAWWSSKRQSLRKLCRIQTSVSGIIGVAIIKSSDVSSTQVFASDINCLNLFCSSVVLDPTVGHTMDVLSPFISVILTDFHEESCPRLDVVHPGRAWPSSPACTWLVLCIISFYLNPHSI